MSSQVADTQAAAKQFEEKVQSTPSLVVQGATEQSLRNAFVQQVSSVSSQSQQQQVQSPQTSTATTAATGAAAGSSAAAAGSATTFTSQLSITEQQFSQTNIQCDPTVFRRKSPHCTHNQADSEPQPFSSSVTFTLFRRSEVAASAAFHRSLGSNLRQSYKEAVAKSAGVSVQEVQIVSVQSIVRAKALSAESPRRYRSLLHTRRTQTPKRLRALAQLATIAPES